MSDSTRPESETPMASRSSSIDARSPDLSARDEEFLYLVGDGSDLMRAGRIAEALREFDRALAISPTNEQALNLKGLCLFRLGRGEEAAAVFEALVEQNREEPSIRLNLAMVYLKLGAFERAKSALTQVLAVNPSHPRARNLMGMVLERLGHTALEVPAVLAAHSTVPPPASELSQIDDDVPEPPTLSELDFAIAMGSDGGTSAAFASAAFESETSADAAGGDGDFTNEKSPDDDGVDVDKTDVPAPPSLALSDTDADTIDVSPASEDDFSDLNADLESSTPGPLAETPSSTTSRDPLELQTRDEFPSSPVERTLPAYDVAGFNAHLARKEAEKAARDAELARQVAAATHAARVAAEQAAVVDEEPVQKSAGPSPVELAEMPVRAPEKLSSGAEAAALVAASTAALRREKAPAHPSEKPRGSFGFSVDDAKGEGAKGSPMSSRAPVDGARVAALVERATPQADGRLENGLLAIPFKDVLYLRTDLMVALTGELEVEPVNRRYRGRRTDTFFGGPKAALSAAMGTGTALVNVDDRVVSVIRLESEDVYLLEGAILAFSDGIVWENGRLPGEKGDDLDIVHLRGEGQIYLLSTRPVVGLTIRSDVPATLRATSLVGWQGQVVPFRGPYPGLPETLERPAIIRFEGTGTVLVG
jgi:uncharacterized protein (AIM24 family)